MAKHILDYGKNKGLISDKSDNVINQDQVSPSDSGEVPPNVNAESSNGDSGEVHDKLFAKVDLSLTLDLDFSGVADLGSPERLEYENQITADFSKLWGLNKIVLLLKPSAQ